MDMEDSIQAEAAQPHALDSEKPDQELQRLFTPRQVYTGAFVGGPLAALLVRSEDGKLVISV